MDAIDGMDLVDIVGPVDKQDVVEGSMGRSQTAKQATRILAPGVYPGLSFAEYRAIDAVNASLLWTLKSRSPAHARYEQLHPSKDTPALLLGRALHSRLLEPATWDRFYAVRPVCDGRTREGRALVQGFRATLGGRTEITAADYGTVCEVEASVRGQQCRELICSGRGEVVIVWTDPATGLSCKARIDYERSDGWTHFIADVKSTGDASKDAFERDIYSYGYFMSAAYYCDGWEAATGEKSVWTWLAVEKEAPYVTKVWEPTARTMKAGRLAYRGALDRYAECVAKDEWPAYGGPELIEMRPWALEREGVGAMDLDGN